MSSIDCQEPERRLKALSLALLEGLGDIYGGRGQKSLQLWHDTTNSLMGSSFPGLAQGFRVLYIPRKTCHFLACPRGIEQQYECEEF
jgi:hypothetical protein